MLPTALFSGLKLRWFEWVLVGAILIGGLIIYFLYNSWLDGRDELVKTKITIEAQSRTIELERNSRDIDDYITEALDLSLKQHRKESRTEREAFEDAYLREVMLSEQYMETLPPVLEEVVIEPTVNQSADVAPTEEQVHVQAKPEAQVRIVYATRPDSPDRAALMVDRLWEQYCNGVPDTLHCATESPED